MGHMSIILALIKMNLRDQESKARLFYTVQEDKKEEDIGGKKEQKREEEGEKKKRRKRRLKALMTEF